MAYAAHTASIGLSAFLLFLLQPMAAKMVLPVFGGGASVWIVSVIFFQVLLFAGYAVSNVLIQKAGWRTHMAIQACFLILSLAFVPFPAMFPTAEGATPFSPPARLFLLLLGAVGLPYFVLSTTSPVVQHWIAGRNRARNPYVQYAVSNAGSLLGLFAYPLAAEPSLSTGMQAALWAVGYGLYAALMVAGMYLAMDGNPVTGGNASEPAMPPLSASIRAKWAGQSMVPSAMLIAITHYLTQDVVNFPLLWVLPLAVYLLTFVVCFSVPAVSTPGTPRALMVVAPLLGLLVLHGGRVEVPFMIKTAVALAALGAVGMFFHGSLERGKPPPARLTIYYMYVSLGGLSGSVLAGIVAPLVFHTTFEFNLAVVAALYFVVTGDLGLKRRGMIMFKGAIAGALCLGWAQQELGWRPGILYSARSFYGTYRVEDVPAEQPGTLPVRRLVAGTHVHGIQKMGGGGEPLAYFHPESGIGLAFNHLPGPRRVAGIGLGAGAVAKYAAPGGQVDFFELDPLVSDIAQTWFSYIKESPAQVRVITGDGRLNLQKAPDGNYDVIVVDAFTSGSVPAHLLTREFVRLCFEKAGEGGVVLFNVSNRYLDLAPVLQGAAHDRGLAIKRHVAPADEARGWYTAVWVAMARSKETMSALTGDDPRWMDVPGKPVYWTDGHSNVWDLLRFEAN